MSEGYYPTRTKVSLDSLWHNLLTASHILHRHSIFDAYGHISVRNPDNKDTFYLPRNVAPALLSKQEDIVEYKVEDGSPVDGEEASEEDVLKEGKVPDGKVPKGYIERFIHSEIYKRFEGVNCVVHSHAREVTAFSVAGHEKGTELKACIHMAGFLGPSVPTWDISSTYSSIPGTTSSTPHDLLIRTTELGHSFSAAFKPSTSSSFLYSKLHSALPSGLSSKAPKPDPSTLPNHPVVLMRGHGFTTCAPSIEEAVFQAVYTLENARIQKDAMVLAAAGRATREESGKIEGKISGNFGKEGGGSGRIEGGKWKSDGASGGEDGGVKGLNARECTEAWESNKSTLRRPWELWCREVEVSPLYRNEIEESE